MEHPSETNKFIFLLFSVRVATILVSQALLNHTQYADVLSHDLVTPRISVNSLVLVLDGVYVVAQHKFLSLLQSCA